MLFHGGRDWKGESVLKWELKEPKQAQVEVIQGRAGRRSGHGHEQRHQHQKELGSDVHL